jgi:hypothetical protein
MGSGEASDKFLPDRVLLDPLPSRVAAAATVAQIHAAAVRGEWAEAYRQGSVLQKLSWEALHTGHWTTVDVMWRTAYAVACFYLATAGVEAARQRSTAADESTKRSILSEAVKAALRHADMGLMLGDTTCRRPLLQLAARLEDTLALLREHDADHSSPWTAVGAQPTLAPAGGTHSISPAPPVTPRALSGSGEPPRLRRPPLPFFYYQCMVPSLPAVLLGVMDAWPAMGSRRWSLDYLVSMAGHRTVPVETGRHYLSDDFDEQLMSLGEFLTRCIAPNAGVGGVAGERAGGGGGVMGCEARCEAGRGASGGAGGEASDGESSTEGSGARREVVSEANGGAGSEAVNGVCGQRGPKRASCRGVAAGGGCGDGAEWCKRARQHGAAAAVTSAGAPEPIGGKSSTVAGSSCRGDAAGSESGFRGSAHDGGTSHPAWGYLAQHQLFEQLPQLRRDITVPDYCSLTLEEEEGRCVGCAALQLHGKLRT